MTSIAAESPIGRRDFLYLAGGAIGSVGTLAALWPFVDQMEPGANILSAGAPMLVNLSSMQLGQQIVVLWRSMPIFIVHRTPAILADLQAASLLSQLRDPASQQPQQPSYAANWSRSLNPEFLVVVGICTHLGCIPAYIPNRGALSPSWSGGYLCHCHGSKYDLAGRVFQGVPASYNLPVPPHHFPDPKTLVIGENPQGQNFDLGSIAQI
ncbi:MAG TPA: ubiquinol-cytochrome c reductase iron-sulfur subunit [Rhizomicrobium sp.]|nr:ubiquinol-cytochrome c reductase iron-sulfur subunit [Rhizomicrobium sp.]